MGSSLTNSTIFTIEVVGVIVFLAFLIIFALARFYVKVPQGWALIINDTSRTPKVKFA